MNCFAHFRFFAAWPCPGHQHHHFAPFAGPGPALMMSAFLSLPVSSPKVLGPTLSRYSPALPQQPLVLLCTSKGNETLHI